MISGVPSIHHFLPYDVFVPVSYGLYRLKITEVVLSPMACCSGIWMVYHSLTDRTGKKYPMGDCMKDGACSYSSVTFGMHLLISSSALETSLSIAVHLPSTCLRPSSPTSSQRHKSYHSWRKEPSNPVGDDSQCTPQPARSGDH